MLRHELQKAEKALENAIRDRVQDPELEEIERNLLHQYRKFLCLNKFGIIVKDGEEADYHMTGAQIRRNEELRAAEHAPRPKVFVQRTESIKARLYQPTEKELQPATREHEPGDNS